MNGYFNRSLGRWQVTLPDGTRVYRYRLVMERYLGRPLRDDEHVHHINGDKSDDRIENLQILSPSEHAKLHVPDRVAARRALRGDTWGPAGLTVCVECGRADLDYLARGMCSRCYYRDQARISRGYQPRRPATVLSYVCEECGETFERPLKRGRGLRFCSRACASVASAKRRWAERRDGRPDAIGRRAA